MPYQHRWRLHYYDRAPFDEAAEGSSIRLAPRSATAIESAGKKVTIPHGCKPIWYRLRGMTMGQVPQLMATVCGFGTVDGAGRVDGKLWCILPNGEWIDAPEPLIERATIENLLEG